MPVRSSLCTYSPSAIGASASNSSSKYSAILPTTSSLSYGNYKPLGSSASGSSAASSRASFRSTPSRHYEPPTGGSSRSSFTSRYNLTASSPSSYSPSSSSNLSHSGPLSSSSGLYKPLDSPASYTPRYGPAGRYSSSSSTNSLSSSTGAGSTHDNHYSYSAYKSPSSSSAYSSGSSLSSSSSSASNNYASKNRRPSYTSNSTSSSLASYRSSLATAADSTETPLPAGVPAGLINLGNTCYMNASLQAIYAMDPLRELLLSNSFRAGSDKELTSQLTELFKLMRGNASGSQSVSPADFKYVFSRHQSKFCGFAQQDAQEFLRYLINGVHEEFNRASPRNRRPSASSAPKTSQEAWQQYRRVVDDSPLVDLLVGQLCSTITCSECSHQSHCWDPFWDLSLPLSMRRDAAGATTSGRFGSNYEPTYGSSFPLRQVIEEFTSKETLDGDERPTCERCKRATRSTKQISWARLPEVLILHLKKFTNDGFKLSSPDIQIDKQLTFNAKNYYLKASISHHGHSSSSGHYTSHCEYAGRWFHFDDARVREVTNTFDCAKLQDAYVLFYTPTRPHSSARRLSQSKL